MIAMRFLDTNILIYAISPLPEDHAKSVKAHAILQSHDCAVSVQVLQEFYFQATRPTRTTKFSPDEALAFIATWERFPVQNVTLDVFHQATRLSRLFRISYWDAAIIAAAKALGCDELLSEDLNAGQNYDGVKVVNPFA